MPQLKYDGFRLGSFSTEIVLSASCPVQRRKSRHPRSAASCRKQRFWKVRLPSAGQPDKLRRVDNLPRCWAWKAELEHDPEKCVAVFPRDKRGTRLRGDHAQSKT